MSHEIYRLIRLLEANKIHFEVGRHRPDSVMIAATLVSERIEIDVFEDGHVEYSRFRGTEDVDDDMLLLETLLDNKEQE